MSIYDPRTRVSVAPRPPLHPVSEWLIGNTAGSLDAEALLDQLNQRLLRHGIPVWRSSLNVHTLHPEVFVRNVVWNRDTGSNSAILSHVDRDSPTYRNSPVSLIYEGSGPIRRRLDVDDQALYFPICRELRDAGGTDYIILPVEFTDGRRTFVSFACDSPGGFSDENVQTLVEVLPFLALRLELESSYFATSSLLQLYLGKNAARRVLDGAFKRGQGQSIHAAIWYCDLRGFTEFSDSHDPREVVTLLDRYFEAVAEPIHAAGGETLKFIGDAILAIFDFSQTDPWQATSNALTAAREALVRVRNIRTQAGSNVEIGIALHAGNVLYGNIGSRGRLDFTVIGAAVNEVCRLETLCKTIGVPIVLSQRFAEMCGAAEPVCLGRHTLKGVKEPQRVFTLDSIAEDWPCIGAPARVPA